MCGAGRHRCGSSSRRSSRHTCVEMSTSRPVDRVLLVGMMGAGKTTVGHALSDLLGWPYFDNDQLLARAVGKDTRRVQAEDGEQALRRAESAALDVALRA